MPEPLEADLDLTITDALSSVDQLTSAMTDAFAAAVDAFQEEFTRATSSLPEVDTSVALDTDTALEQLSLFSSNAEAEPVDITVDADTSDAQASVDDLTSSMDEGGDSSKSYADSVGLVSGAAGAARGEVAGAATAIGALSFTSAGGLAAVGALGASVFSLYEKGVDATGAMQRFDQIVGEMGPAVQNVHVGSLNTDLDQLAIKLGTNEAALHNANASVFQFAINSGASREQAAQFANQLTALGARGVALNPAIGTVDQAVESLSVRLSRGGRFASQYGITLSTAEINARALADTGKTTASDLTIYEKSAAAAAIATERYGDSINKTVNEGSKNAIITQRSLQEQINKVLEAVGKPLVAPIFDLIKSSEPDIEALASSIGLLAQASIPLFQGALEALTPALQLAAQLITAVTGVTENLGLTATASGAALGFMVAGPWGALVGAAFGLASDLGLVSSGLDNVKNSTAKLASEIDRMSAQNALAAFLKDVNAQIAHAESIGAQHQSLLGNELRVFRDLANEDAGAAQRVLSAMDPASASFGRFAAILNTSAANQRNANAATAAAKNSTDALTGATQASTAALADRNDQILASYDKGFALIHANEQLRDAVSGVNTAYDDAIKAGKSQAEALDAQSRAETAAEEAVVKSTSAVGAKAQQDYAALGAEAAARQGTIEQIGALQALQGTLDPNSPLYKFVQGLIDKLNDPALNAPHTTSVQVEGVEVTEQQLANIKAAAIDTANAIGRIQGGGQFATAATGAIVPPTPGGSLWRVGEAGATEVIVPTDDPRQARRLLAMGGLGQLLASPGTAMDYDKLAAAIVGAQQGQRPLIGTAHFSGSPLADLDYFHKTRMAGV